MKRTKKEEAPVEKSKVEEAPVEEPKVEEAVVPEAVVPEIKVPARIRWRKTGGGSLRLKINGVTRIIKPNEMFTALPEEIPMAFRDNIIPLEQFKNESLEPPKLEAVKSVYKVVPRGKSKSLFDIIDSQGKLVNDKSKPLPKSIAEQFVRDLEK